jgi:predicted transcriptional regulator
LRSHRIRLDDDLMEKVKQCAAKAGYSSPEEFVIHVLEKEVARVLSPDAQVDPEEEVKKRLRGLGYID